ncbi:GNAT family N-acetyltransferase [Nitratifractor sp.]|uniref:GNAT family N-acetyltransferase n=1 Tax=Nitratifractor sp. TaxID=2268144 RepID=UPI0025D6BFEB|nr:GNAT family N-acetyltransferase [Nitratifractor sp.]
MKIREMTMDDYDEVIDMLKITPGITVREADSRNSTKRYLERNPGLSFVATIEDRIVGCVMCGHDGRRGYLQHLVVKPENRRQGIGEALFTACIDSLKQVGIDKTHLFVFKSNSLANSFWESNGWILRDEVNIYSYNVSSNDNA